MNSDKQYEISESYKNYVAEIVFDNETRKRMLNVQIWRSCINCMNYVKDREQCYLNKKRPPAEIIVYGCECWDNDIPF